MTEMSIAEFLAANPFFSGMDDAALQILSQHAREGRIAKGEVLFRQGERATEFYLVRAGSMTVEIPALYGPALEIQKLGEGDLLGWSWLISPYRWSFQARAREDTELLEFDGAALLARCEEDPAFGYEVLKRFAALMSKRLDAARQKMMDAWNPSGFA